MTLAKNFKRAVGFFPIAFARIHLRFPHLSWRGSLQEWIHTEFLSPTHFQANDNISSYSIRTRKDNSKNAVMGHISETKRS